MTVVQTEVSLTILITLRTEVGKVSFVTIIRNREEKGQL